MQRIHNKNIEIYITDKDQARRFQEEFSAFTPGYKMNTRYRAGMWDGKKKFYTITTVKGGWLFRVKLGFKGRVENFTNEKFPKEIDYNEIKTFLKKLIPELPFKPYKHQVKMILGMGSSTNQLGVASVGAGKSLVIYALSRFYRAKGLKVLCLVPTVDLVNQLKDDFLDYNAPEQFITEIQQIGGEFNNKNITQPLVISTWQSACKADLSQFDIVINDEVHLSKADVLLEILSNPFKVKLGLTGTPPIDQMDALLLEQNFGYPETYITAKGLIDLGLATDLSVVAMFLNQKAKIMKYQDEIKFIKESSKRQAFIAKFTKRLKGLKIMLYQHTQHGKDTWESLTGLELTTKRLGDFKLQKDLGVFFMSGSTPAKTRKLILDYLKTVTGKEDITLIGQSKILSTGINIKPLKHLIFLSAGKSYTQIIQSIGRVLRLHGSKSKAVIWDLVDNFSDGRKTENHALKHFWARLGYYEFQGFEVHEKEIQL